MFSAITYLIVEFIKIFSYDCSRRVVFSRKSDSTTTNVRPLVRPSESKTPKQLKIIHFTLPQHSPPLISQHTTSQNNITTQHHTQHPPHNITMQHHTLLQPSSSSSSISSFTVKLFSFSTTTFWNIITSIRIV